MTTPTATPELIERVTQGFSGLSLADEHKQAALSNLEKWLDEQAEYRPQLEWLIADERWALLLDSFYRVLPFGTGGRRGPVGIGTNRFNSVTLAGSVQGHVDYLRDAVPDTDLSVVVVYDVRAFHDLRGLYNPELPNPLLGTTSRDFARLAAEVYAGNGIRVYLPPDDFEDFVSTPELSFAIRHHGACAGLNISASHNHPDDNGGKFYNAHGGQEVPPNDEDMAKRVESAGVIQRLPLAQAESDGLLTRIGAEVHRAYVDLNVAQSLRPDARSATIVFTPLHGSGGTTAGDVLRAAGFSVETVPEQATLDGRFPAVPFRAPNPEVPESMELGIALARERGADLVMACDPDADRIGACARTASGDYRFLTGNEIALLVASYKLEQLRALGRLPSPALVIKTEVTTEMLRPITRAYGGAIIGDLLVGFKYHGHVLEQLENEPAEDDPRPRPLARLGIDAELSDFVVAAEESHGVLVTAEIRDKDAAGAALLLAELASVSKERGRTIIDYLDDLYREYGYHANLLCSMVMTGAEGLEAISKIQKALRESPPKRIGRWSVHEVIDHQDPGGIHGPILSETDRASRNVLRFTLDGGARVVIRPSGTEPKNKIYIEVPAEPLGAKASDADLEASKHQANAEAREIADEFTRAMLTIIDVELPDYALRISGLVPLDKRIDFVEAFVPGLLRRAGETNAAALSEWIDEHLADYGKDARGLVVDAIRALLEERRAHARGDDPSAAALDRIEEAFFGE